MNYHFWHKVLLVCVFAAAISFAWPAHVYALNLTARISDQSTEVMAGDRLYFEVEMRYPENPIREDLQIEYQIVENGSVIASEKVLRAVETQISFLDYIVIPQGIKSGTKELNIIVTDYGQLHQESSASFRVVKGQNQVELYFLILLGAIVLLSILVVTQIVVSNRRSRPL